MAKIRDHAISESSSDSTSHTGVLPTYEEDDLLLWIVGKDSEAGGAFSTPSGWTELSMNDNAPGFAARFHVFYKVAGVSETAPQTTSTDSNAWQTTMFSFMDVDTTDPINASGDAFYNSSSKQNFETVTTDKDDCLIFYAILNGISNTTMFMHDGPVPYHHHKGDDIVIDTAYSYQESAGTTPTVSYIGASNHLNLTIAINSNTASEIPLYISGSHGEMIVTGVADDVNPNAGSYGNITPTTINGETTYDVSLASEGNSHINTEFNALKINFYLSPGDFAGYEYTFNSTKDLSGGQAMYLLWGYQARRTESNTDLVENNGVGFYFNNSTNYKAFTMGGNDKSPSQEGVFPFICDPEATSHIDSGGSLSSSSITGYGFGCVALSGSVSGALNSGSGILGTMKLVGGTSGGKGELGDIVIPLEKLAKRTVIKQGTSQFLLFTPIQFGDNSNSTNIDISATVIEFAPDKDGTITDAHVVPGYLGITYSTTTGDNIDHRNAIINSASPYHFEVKDNTSNGTLQFTGLQVIGADPVTLGDTLTYPAMTFSGCGQIDGSGLTFSGTIFNSPMSGENSALLMSTATSLTDCQFSTDTAADYAIEISAAGTYALSGCTFSGFTKDIYVSATTGTVTINITGGGDTPTYDSDGATVVVNNNVTVSVTVKDATSKSAIEGVRVLVSADTGGDLPAGDSVTITRSGSTASVSHTAHGLSSGDEVEIEGANEDEYNGVFTISNVTTNAYDYTISGTPATPATGTITSTAVIINTTSNASGVAQNTTFQYTSNQPITGRCRLGSGTPYYYKTGDVVGMIDSGGFDITVLLIRDE